MLLFYYFNLFKINVIYDNEKKDKALKIEFNSKISIISVISLTFGLKNLSDFYEIYEKGLLLWI